MPSLRSVVDAAALLEHLPGGTEIIVPLTDLRGAGQLHIGVVSDGHKRAAPHALPLPSYAAKCFHLFHNIPHVSLAELIEHLYDQGHGWRS